MTEAIETQADVDALTAMYIAYIESLRGPWSLKNRTNFKEVYEVLRPEQQAEVHRRIAQGEYYIAPLAEVWWKERGFGITWPADNAEPMKVYKL